MLMQTTYCRPGDRQAIFISTANSLPGLTAIPTPTITVTDVGLQRTVTVSYNAASINNFPKVLLDSRVLADQWLIDGEGVERAQHEFLSAAGQLAVHGDRRDPDRHQ